ncbi:hypothetical protein B0J18DRAFT_278437 [Chaetomium sp. MPI-SDFR-AT-0129]|nr:hypothetical protein B0J18DRAFT_278437 [Chaetomium sp. MPI-SDFR-AT-0129]
MLFNQLLCYLFSPWQLCRRDTPSRPAVLPLTQNSKMARPEQPSHFTLHVFVNHNPTMARVLLPDLFADFPDSAWELPPLISLPPRSREKPKREEWVIADPRTALGRHVFSEPVAGNTTLLQLSEEVEREFGVLKKYQGQFTIFPQEYGDERSWWNDRPLPWNMTLAEVRRHDLGAVASDSNGSSREILKAYAPVLHLVLETKPVALERVLGGGFLEKEIGSPEKFFGTILNDQYNSFGRYYRENLRWSRLGSTLRAWRKATFAHAYLAKQREKSRLRPDDDDELRRMIRRVGEIQETLALRPGLSPQERRDLDSTLNTPLPRIRQMAANESNGRQDLRQLSIFLAQWDRWMEDGDFGTLTFSVLEPDEVELKVASLVRRVRQFIDEWKSSEGKRQLEASIIDEFYLVRPWLTEDDRTRAETDALERLKGERLQLERSKQREDLPQPTVQAEPEGADAWMGNNIVPPPPIQAHAIRDIDGTFLSDQSGFTVSSGSLLWGQIVCLYSTMSHPNFTQNVNHMPPELEGGTILQHRFSYRSAARNGQWKVRQYNERVGDLIRDSDHPAYPAGWILHHEDIDPRNTLARVRALDGTGPGAVSNRNRHTDKDIVYIGRYDWSHLYHRNLEPEFQQWAEPVIGPNNPDHFEQCNVRKGGYLVAADEANFGLDFVAAYKRDCESGFLNSHDRYNTFPIEKLFRKNGENFGAFLGMAYAEEYDYGWLVFSGEQHPDHGVDELVAIVYSNEHIEGTYHFLEGESSPLS